MRQQMLSVPKGQAGVRHGGRSGRPSAPATSDGLIRANLTAIATDPTSLLVGKRVGRAVEVVGWSRRVRGSRQTIS
jgi:hypothetical protein